MNAFAPLQLQRAVTAICPDIADRANATPRVRGERRLWWELSCCLLSSQVPYALAAAASDRIAKSDLLILPHADEADLADDLTTLLTTPLSMSGSLRRYRFPHARARQLAATTVAIHASAGSLSELIRVAGTGEAVREWLVANAPGIGPKQASMFVRNVGLSYELAILDRHVLNYMTALDITPTPIPTTSSLPRYLKGETALRVHADDIGVSVGLLDWAIWIVMRVAKTTKKEVLAA
ncbi:N-glycosylase/DNA lyase [Sphingomonas endophytica]|uniref:N-glycosylase/DNA lyase n=1 Tax=Sphingomonas endophytica TaxID=869719 RepID=A0A7X0MNR9_9SPHN|nr:DNA lyase [Sphingomonas endophytica]MBB6503763.1 N-glycosylase/DNA lyase [Sphingomonas endophytica]